MYKAKTLSPPQAVLCDVVTVPPSLWVSNTGNITRAGSKDRRVPQLRQTWKTVLCQSVHTVSLRKRENKGALFFWFPRTLCVSHLTASLSAGPHVFLYLLHLTTHAGLHLPRPSCWAPAGCSRSLRPLLLGLLLGVLGLCAPRLPLLSRPSGSSSSSLPLAGMLVAASPLGTGCVCGSSISSFVGALCSDSSLPPPSLLPRARRHCLQHWRASRHAGLSLSSSTQPGEDKSLPSPRVSAHWDDGRSDTTDSRSLSHRPPKRKPPMTKDPQPA